MTALPPVFLIPLGRTGGTLLVTMLDAHPDLAMSYEIYEDRLLDERGDPVAPSWIIDRLEQTRRTADDAVAWIKSVPEKNIQVFFFRARRAGLEIDDVLDELKRFLAGEGTFATLEGRLEFIDLLMQRKMRLLGKRGWGGKARTDPSALRRRHPEAAFLTMIRDGRDMFASMLHTGSFNTNAGKAAAEWMGHIRAFRSFASEAGVRAMEVRYEALVGDPESVLRDVCSFIGVSFAPQMIEFHRSDLPLLRNPHGHLSHQQIARGLNAESIGRWKRDLSAEEVAAFEERAGPLLRDLGYAEASGSGSRLEAQRRGHVPALNPPDRNRS